MSNPNPYLSPSFDPKQFQDYSSPYPPPQSGGFGWVQQIRVVAILNCVQGGLEIVAGLGFLSIAIFAAVMIGMERDRAGIPNGGGPPAGLEWFMGGLYGGMGAIALLAGIFRFYAGLQNFRYRKRVLGIVSFVCGLASISVCYCLPTSLCMAVYGLIVHLNPAVQAAFAMGDKGVPPDVILNSFLPYPPQQVGQAPFPTPQPPSFQPPFPPPPAPPV